MVDAMKVMDICEQINRELEQKQKTFVLLKLLEFISLGKQVSERELDFVLSVATAFNIDETEYLNCKNFVFDLVENIPEKQNIVIFSATGQSLPDGVIHKKIGDISGNITFLHIKSTNSFAFRSTGNQTIYLNGQSISPKQVYLFANNADNCVRISQL